MKLGIKFVPRSNVDFKILFNPMLISSQIQDFYNSYGKKETKSYI